MARAPEYEEWGGGDGAWSEDQSNADRDARHTDEEETDTMGYYEEDHEGGGLGAFVTGLTIGLLIGSGVALLLAPQSGEVTRKMIEKRARRVGGDVSDRWEDLRDELDLLARRGRKRMRRGLKRGRWSATRGRWKAEDLVDRGRRLVR